MSTETADMMLTRAAAASGSTANEADRSVEIAFASASPVKRYSWEEGYYLEVLEVTRQAINTERMDVGMSLLDSHRVGSMADRLGSVMPGTFRIADGKAFCRVRFSHTEAAERVWRDVLAGHVIPISVGYRIEESKKTEGAGDALPTITATRWVPLEVSAVPVAADPTASTRAQEATVTDTPNQNPVSERQEPHERQALTQQAVRRERERVRELQALGRSAGMAEDLVNQAIDNGTSVDAFRNAAFDAMIARQAQSPTFPHVDTRENSRGHDADEMAARVEAVACRMTGKAPGERARQYMSTPLIDHARGMLESRGIRTAGMSREQLIGGYGGARSYAPHTTSDFPLLLQGAGERVLLDAYQLAQSPLKEISRRSTASDFRAKSRLKISDAGLLEKVSESGEITATTRSETSESYKIDTFGRIFALSFQAIINDDLGAFADWSKEAGRMSAATEAKVMLDTLLTNNAAGPLMSDNKALFHADHKNLSAAGTALDETNIGVAIKALRYQKSPSGYRVSAPPKYLLVGPSLEQGAQKLLSMSYVPTTTADVMPDSVRNLTLLVEPNLDDQNLKPWYVFSDPASAPVFEYSYLSGHDGPQIDSREGFERLGTEFRAVLHFGAGAIDFRGAYRNPGVA